jgi:hypothetical protein
VETESLAFELKDQMSNPAREMKRALGELKASMRGVGNEITELQAKQLKYREQGMNGLASQVGLEIAKRKMAQRAMNEQAKDGKERLNDLAQAQKAQSKASGVEADAMEALGGVFVEVAKYALVFAAALVAIVFEGAKLAAEAYTFRTHMTNVFSIFRGTAAEG